MYERILVATDGSVLSKKAVSSAISLAALAGASLIAIKVVPRYPQSYFEGGLALQAAEVGRIEQQWADEGQAVVEEVKKLAELEGVKTRARGQKAQVRPDRDGVARPQRGQAAVAWQRNTPGFDAFAYSGSGFKINQAPALYP